MIFTTAFCERLMQSVVFSFDHLRHSGYEMGYNGAQVHKMTPRTSHARSALLGTLVAAAVLVGAGTNFVARKHLSLYEDGGGAHRC